MNIKERIIRSKMRETRKATARHLTARQNESLTLYYLGGHHQREIADILGIHQTTVSQHAVCVEETQELLYSIEVPY